MKTLNLKNVIMYLDAGHAGWLGWTANITPAAQLFATLFKDAGSPAAVRGLATNVANYNAWTIATCPSYTQGNTICDEKRYVNAIAPLLTQNGFPAHFITDTGKFSILAQHRSPTHKLTYCQVVTASSQPSNRHGATGAMLSAPGSAFDPALPPTTLFSMPSFGSSLAVNATGHQTLLRHGMMRTAVMRMP